MRARLPGEAVRGYLALFTGFTMATLSGVLLDMSCAVAVRSCNPVAYCLLDPDISFAHDISSALLKVLRQSGCRQLPESGEPVL